MELILSVHNTTKGCRIAPAASSCKTICYYGNRCCWRHPQFNKEQEFKWPVTESWVYGQSRALGKHSKDDISVRTCTWSRNRVTVFVLARLSAVTKAVSKCDMLQISSCTCQENCLKKRFNELKVLMRVKTRSEHSCQTSAARSLKWISLFTKATTIRGEKKKNSLWKALRGCNHMISRCFVEATWTRL